MLLRPVRRARADQDPGICADDRLV